MSTLTAPACRPFTASRGLGRAQRRVGRSGAVRVRWDRLVALLAVLVLALWVLGVLGAGMAGLSQADPVAQAPVQVVVRPGDTLWDMARAHAPTSMPTLEYVMLVEQHNGVRAGALLPGTVVELPVLTP